MLKRFTCFFKLAAGETMRLHICKDGKAIAKPYPVSISKRQSFVSQQFISPNHVQ